MASSLHASVFSLRRNLMSARNRSTWLISQRRIKTDAAEEEGEAETVYVNSENVFQINQWREPIKISCGDYAGLADGCAVAEFGGSAVMATAVGKGHPAYHDIPLTVNYKQKTAAIGRIPTNFLRRDVGLTDNEILTSRVIDRSLRPLFELGKAIETQIVCNPLALDGQNFPEPLAINAASAALAISDIPWNGPVAAARAALIDNEVVINPTKLELLGSPVNMIVTSIKNNVVMLEGSFSNVLMNDVMLCIKAALKYSKKTLETINNLQKKYGKNKRDVQPSSVPEDIKERMLNAAKEGLYGIFTSYEFDKLGRDKHLKDLYESCVANLREEFPEVQSEVFETEWVKILKQIYRDVVHSTGKRCDGRGVLDMRPITCKTHLYEALHGSAIFKRGQTQVFCTVALDSPNSALRMDQVSMLVSGVKEKNFFLHYDFPPYATGEVGTRPRYNRREVGHGNLAEKALNHTIPESFPFTIRLSSEVFESNGSSSMATVCSGTLALLDAGIPIQYPVAGVAMGLLTQPDHDVGDAQILTDIMGMEDFLGDMDFKIAGSKVGFTALQLDMKIPGLPIKLVGNALAQGKRALGHIFQTMKECINQNRHNSNDNWPVIEDIEIPQYLKPKFIGSGGAKLKRFELDVGVEVLNFENDVLTIFAVNKAAMKEAKDRLEEFVIKEKAIELEFGGVYTATVVEVKSHGCYVTLHPSIPPAFITLSQLDHKKVAHPSALGFDVGTQLKVKYFGRDPVSGILRLSRKVLFGRDESN